MKVAVGKRKSFVAPTLMCASCPSQIPNWPYEDPTRPSCLKDKWILRITNFFDYLLYLYNIYPFQSNLPCNQFSCLRCHKVTVLFIKDKKQSREIML